MEKKQGNTPALSIKAKNIPQAYERAMKRVWEKGANARTQYDLRDKDGEFIHPPSKDASVVIEISDPFSQPRFHRSFYDSLDSLGKYTAEVVSGAHDYRMLSPKQVRELVELGKRGARKEELSASGLTKWPYTYNQRLFRYPLSDGSTIDQVELMIKKITGQNPDTGEIEPYTRRAQAITWVPFIDPFLHDPPCLQNIWGRCLEDEEGILWFNMNTRWRSRDLMKAWPENVVALTTLQKKIAEDAAKRLGREVKVGRYIEFNDSLHIYGSYFEEIKGNKEAGIKSFFDALKSRKFKDRTWDSDYAKEFFISGLEDLLREEGMPEETKEKIRKELELVRNSEYIV